MITIHANYNTKTIFSLISKLQRQIKLIKNIKKCMHLIPLHLLLTIPINSQGS